MSITEAPTITGQSRPKTHDDLEDWQREGHPVATVNADMLVAYPSLGLHLLAALTEAKQLGLTVQDGKITAPRADEELDKALASAQLAWDRRRDEYLAACGDPASITESYRRRWIDAWAAKEGLSAIEWPVTA